MWRNQPILWKESRLPVLSLAVPVYIVEDDLQKQKNIYINSYTLFWYIYMIEDSELIVNSITA